MAPRLIKRVYIYDIFFIGYLMKTAKIVMVVKKIVRKIVKNKTPDSGNNQSHLNHCFLKRLLIETFL